MTLYLYTADSGITFEGPASTMPTKTKLECKVADLRQQFQTATENYTEAQATIEELQQERDEALESARQLEVALSEMSRVMEDRVHAEIEIMHHTLSTAHQREVETQADLISMLKDRLAWYEGNLLAGAGLNDPHSSRDSHGVHLSSYSVATDVNSEALHVVLTINRPTWAP